MIARRWSCISSIARQLLFFPAIAAFLCCLPSRLLSQGVIQGTVTDSLDSSELIGANVFLVGTSLGSATDREGKYRIIGIPAGAYILRVSYLGYRSKDVEVNVGNDDLTVNAQLSPDIIEAGEVLVTAQARGQIAAINQQITSTTIMNVVSREKIQELPDANAAEAVGRLPGVSIIRSGGEANRVILRGLEDKFANITIDGVKIPATDATGRGVDLSMLSQGSLAGIELYKALTPDKDGDAVAGGINLVTRKAPETRQFKLDLKRDYNDLMRSLNQYIYSFLYGERFFNDIVGVQLSGNLEKRVRSNERINVNYGVDFNTGQPDYFINDFLLEFTDETRHREGMSLLLDFNTPDNGTIRLNNVYGKTKRDYVLSIRDYPTQGGGSQQGATVYDYRDREQVINTFSSSLRGDNTILGFGFNWGLSFAESKSGFPYDYQVIFVEPSGMNPAPRISSNPEQLIPYAVNNFANASLYWAYFRRQNNYDKERTAFADISGQYLIGETISGVVKVGAKLKLKDRSNLQSEDFTPYYLGRWQRYERLPGDTLRQKDFTGTHFEDWLENGGGFIGIDFFLFENHKTRNVYNKYLLNPLVMRDKIRQWRDLNKYGVDATGNQQEIWVNPLIKYDDYFVKERVAAGYIMNTLNISQDLTIIGGVRIENEFNDYQSTFIPSPVGGFPIPTNSIKDTTSSDGKSIVLPNINISYRPLGFLNVRVAVYKALARPDFNMRMNRFIAGRPAEVGSQTVLYVGNTSLKAAQAWNYELNTTVHDNSIGLFSLSLYYKNISNMFHMLNNFNTVGDTLMQRFGITWKSQLQTTPYNITLPYNSPEPTTVWGVEFEHQINFHFLPEPFSGILLSYNASIVRSETVLYGSEVRTYVDSSGPFPLTKSYTALVERRQKLEGMPEFFGNVALGYDYGGFSGRVSVFHQGEHNVSFSATGLSDVVTNAFTRLDIALKQKITSYVTVFLNINNITNIEDGTTIVNRPYNKTLFNQSEKYGLTADFGITVEL